MAFLKPPRKSIVSVENNCINFKKITPKIKSKWFYVKIKIKSVPIYDPQRLNVPPYRSNKEIIKLINFCVNNCEDSWSRTFSGFYFKSKEDFLKATLAW